MLIWAPLGGSPLVRECNFTFSQTSHGGAAFSLLLSLFLGHSHFLCPSSPYAKHFTTSSTFSCLLASRTPHCITLLLKGSNLLPPTILFFCSLFFLHFQARCPKPPHFLQSLPSLPSNSALNLARARLLLSMLLMSLLYCSRDIMLCSGQVGVKGFVLLFEGLVMFFTYLTFTSTGVHYLHPARCLLPY